MPSPDDFDFELQQGTGVPVGPPPRRVGIGAIIAVLIVAIGVGLTVWQWRSRRGDTTGPAQTATEATINDRAALGAPAPPIELPALGESDDLVRRLVRQLSSHPDFAAWLVTDGLVRQFVAVVHEIAEGQTPAARLKGLKPTGQFRVRERGDDLLLDPASYDRYNRLVDVSASIDAQGAARLYTTLKPLIEEAYVEVGYPDRPFDRTLEQAIRRVLATPVTDRPVLLEPHGANYQYADSDLEELSAAQKQLLRMGPRNQRTVQAKVREIAIALGVRL